MLYLIGLALAFIFGWIMRGERESWKKDDAKPLDLDLTEEEPSGEKLDWVVKDGSHDADWKNAAIFYSGKGGRAWN